MTTIRRVRCLACAGTGKRLGEAGPIRCDACCGRGSVLFSDSPGAAAALQARLDTKDLLDKRQLLLHPAQPGSPPKERSTIRAEE